ncbi:MAG: hypothetical protein FWB97_05515 [Oscillospiraceae bacterium]|nr:hypothetical protein [Oscillospiraceae bacterium]
MPRILLVEPDYKNKYPPIALMKLATYHRGRGDIVEFYKGEAPYTKIIDADRIYITSMFTYQYSITAKTIKHYMKYKHVDSVFIGGIAVSLLADKFISETGATKVLRGLLTDSNALGYDDCINIDELPLDYDILDDISYKYPAGDNYFIHTTRGCPRRCEFCAVRILEPTFETTNRILTQIEQVDEKYGQKRNLLMMDNNILFSPQLAQIADDIVASGFDGTPNFTRPNEFKLTIDKIERRIKLQIDYSALISRAIDLLQKFSKRIARYEKVFCQFNEAFAQIVEADDKLAVLRQHREYISGMFETYSNKTKMVRYVDFNQGIDARLISPSTIAHLAKLPIRPFRLAFDGIDGANVFTDATNLAISSGFRHFSNYILYNWMDTPEDLWKRLDIAVTLYNQSSDLRGFSFPMRFTPIDKTDRAFVGEFWNKKYLRAINVIINVTKGVIARERDFFEEAFGRNVSEFLEILAMPDELIRFRHFFRDMGLLKKWTAAYRNLADAEREELLHVLSEMVDNPQILENAHSEPVADILYFYAIRKKQIELIG